MTEEQEIKYFIKEIQEEEKKRTKTIRKKFLKDHPNKIVTCENYADACAENYVKGIRFGANEILKKLELL